MLFLLSCVLQFIANIDSADDHATELKSMCFSSIIELYIVISTNQLTQTIIASEVGGYTE